MDQFKPTANLINSISIAAAVCFLVVIVMAVLVLRPQFQELRIVQQNIEEKRAELRAKQEYALKLDEIKIKLEENQEEVAKIKTALPANPSIPSLLNYLQKASSEAGLILIEISPFVVFPSEEFINIKETTLSIKVSGSYDSLKSFVSNLEKSARLIGVENISFSSADVEEAPTFNLRFKTFSY